jgi:hypothetical protein
VALTNEICATLNRDLYAIDCEDIRADVQESASPRDNCDSAGNVPMYKL